MNKKKLLLSMFAVFLLLLLAACGCDTESGSSDTDTDSDDNESSDGETPDFLSLLTGGTSGTYYPLGGEIAKNITDDTGIQTDAKASNASADNVKDLAERAAELTFLQTDAIT